jgi:hypothetical protein
MTDWEIGSGVTFIRLHRIADVIRPTADLLLRPTFVNVSNIVAFGPWSPNTPGESWISILGNDEGYHVAESCMAILEAISGKNQG